MEFGPLDYYSRLPADGVLRELRTSGNLGLTESEARRRIAHFGKNEVEAESEETPLSEFLHTFRNPLVTVLIVAAAVSALLGEVTEPIIILTIVLASSALGVWQEHSANDAVKKLKSLVAVTATVIRNGERKEIRTPSITVGDVILLSAGDLVPADCRVIEENDIYVKQSAITGEPFPVEKTVGGTGEENRTAGDVQMADSKEETEGKKDKTGNSQAAEGGEGNAVRGHCQGSCGGGAGVGFRNRRAGAGDFHPENHGFHRARNLAAEPLAPPRVSRVISVRNRRCCGPHAGTASNHHDRHHGRGREEHCGKGRDCEETAVHPQLRQHGRPVHRQDRDAYGRENQAGEIHRRKRGRERGGLAPRVSQQLLPDGNQERP
ncbi:hypothetical protein HY095_03745 [Candidatus Micrarchaeota archaeon]|nr:hypothetical protein [Candidatus Micrarchaeota archaeon]